MGKYIKPVLLLLGFFILSSISSPVSEAAEAKPSKLTLEVSIDDPGVFWDFVYLTRDGNLVKADTIQIGWSLGDLSKGSKYEVAVKQGKPSGKVTIVTEKGALVNYRVSVRDAQNNEIGAIGLQIQNKGQTEYIMITHPAYTEPIIIYGNEAKPKVGEPF